MTPPSPFIDEIVENCLAARVRMIGRAVTAIYERTVSGHGVTISQVNLLAALGKLGPTAPGRLGQVLQLERSTVSRNLDILLENKWVRAVSSDDKGVKEVTLTAAGRKKIESLMTDWRVAQKEAATFLGEDGVRAVHSITNALWQSDAT